MSPQNENKKLVLSKATTLNSVFALLGFFSIFSFVSSCGKKPDQDGAGSAVPEASDRILPEELMTYIESQLSSDDLKNFSNRFDAVCPQYNSLDESLKKKSIAAFATSIASAESDLNSFTTFYEESLGYDSVGLFQLSYGDKKTYGCQFSEKEDSQLDRREKKIFQTDVQVDCFLKISRKLITTPEKFPYLRNLAKKEKEKSIQSNPRYLKLTQKLSAYWSVLRPSNEAGLQKFNRMKKKLMPRLCEL